MKWKKRISISIVSLAAAVLFAGNVDAAPSNAGITFSSGVDAPDVLDPSDPTIEYEPTGPTDPQDDVTGESGALTLDYVSSVSFGAQTIESGTATYNSTTLRPFIQVSDRRGTGEGWNVTAQLSNFAFEGENTLSGAALNFTDGEVISNSTSAAPAAEDSVVLSAGGDAATVVTAEEDAGLGSWITRWYPSDTAPTGENDNVRLEVPSGAATLGDHTAVITWTLSATPTGTTPAP